MGLYLAQGLPGGLVAYTLPTLLRQQGASLKLISLISFLSLPWAFKLLWAKPLDQSNNRTPWFYLSLFCAAVLWLGLSAFELSVWLKEWIYLFCALLLMANFVMASQDILTDGLVVRLLDEKDRGLANGFQVVAYKAGMLISGGLFLTLYQFMGWQQGMQSLVVVLFIAYLPFVFLSQSKVVQQSLTSVDLVNETEADVKSKKDLLNIVLDFVNLPGMKYWLLILACYKLGDGMISSLTKPFWVDLGVSEMQIGLASSIGIGLGIVAGLFAGFLWKYLRNKNVERRFILLAFSLLQCSGILAYYYLSVTPFNETVWWVLVLFEQVVDVMSTVVVFTGMMACCRREYAGIDYTFQATLFLIFSQSMHVVSGFLGDAFGYSVTFMVAICLTFPIIFLLLNKKQFVENYETA